MIRIKRKAIRRIALFFTVLGICLMVFLSLRALSDMWRERAVSQSPKQTLSFVIDIEQREKLFEQLNEFAVDHDFDIHIGATTPAYDTFSIYLSRNDVVIWGGNALNPLGYDISFYDKDPAHPVSEEVIDSLKKDLKEYINDVPNIRIFD